MKRTTLFLVSLALASLFSPQYSNAEKEDALASMVISSDWQLQDAAKVPQSGQEISGAGFKPVDWVEAVVPGTVLTSLVHDKVYPEPLYGENNRPDKIPESLCRTSYWYRTSFDVPENYSGKKIWLNFNGINYSAKVWVNGKSVGTIRGAFSRGIFDVSQLVTPGKKAVLAVLVSPQPHPGISHEHTLGLGMGQNGGITAEDGPTFLCTIGWDWIPAIRDRDTGIWQKVFLSATGPVRLVDPLVTTDLPLPKLDSADIGIQVTLENLTSQVQTGDLTGSFGDTSFSMPVTLSPRAIQKVVLDPRSVPQLRLKDPRLWWPNGYGPQNLYALKLTFTSEGVVSDKKELNFGVRELTYSVPDSDNLTLSVNGVPVFCKGGNWGMDEALKRIPRERLEAQVRMHQLANYTMIRNWVGQSTSEDLYDLCDQYGILLWDEFFQPHPNDGPHPEDLELYLANVREKILRFRNHPSVAVWCARNEGFPPKEIDTALRRLMSELEPTRMYQPSSTSEKGVMSGGPYCWRTPEEFYDVNEPFKTETGSVSVPTLESIQGMMPEKDWETINDDWAEHDMARGAQKGDLYPKIINDRYGPVTNLADFVRKAQLANYEAFRAMYEGRNAKLFHPFTGVITWMSNPAQPSFVWQLYHHDLEPNASLFAVRKACEPVHIQLNEKEGIVQVVNNLPKPLTKAKAHLSLFDLKGKKVSDQTWDVTAPASGTVDISKLDLPSSLTSLYFAELDLRDASGKRISDNFYWKGVPGHKDDLQALNAMPVQKLGVNSTRMDAKGNCSLKVNIRNPGPGVALMVHLQLRGAVSGKRILPVYYSDNYVSLTPGETKTIVIEAAASELRDEKPLVLVDGWNVSLEPFVSPSVSVEVNQNAQVGHWPVTRLPMAKP